MAPPAVPGTRFHGIFTSIICPMDGEGRIDEAALSAHAAAVFRGTGLAGFLVNGHAGENATLAPEETARVIRIVRQVAPEALVVAGVNAEGSAAAADLARIAAEAGAEAAMVFAPFSWALGVDPRAIARHHALVHDATDLPLFLFQGAVRSGLAYPLPVLDRLLDLPRVVGIKEGSWDVDAYARLRAHVRARRPEVGVMASPAPYPRPSSG